MVFKEQDLREVRFIKEGQNFYKLNKKSALECLELRFDKSYTREQVLQNLALKINDESIDLKDKLELSEDKAFIILSQKYECEKLELTGGGDCIFRY